MAQAGGLDGGGDSFGGLADGGVGESDDDGAGFVGFAGVDFDFHFPGFDPVEGGGIEARDHVNTILFRKTVFVSK